jgi:hypothetical protein
MNITCEKCDTVMAIPDDSPSRSYKCPDCGARVRYKREDESDDFDEGSNRAPGKLQEVINSNSLRDIVLFRLMLTPVLMQIFFWTTSILLVLVGLKIIFDSVDARVGWFREFVAGLFVLIFGPLYMRCTCEVFILLFKIHDELKAINDKNRKV